VKSAGRDRLLSSILTPHAEVAPQYVAFQVETRDGDQLVAVIDRETPSAVTLRLGGGQEITLPRSQVRSMTSSGQSLMPEGLVDGLPVQAVADLLEFIAAAEPPVPSR
jgi:putative heme-binding domain-containing protein